MEIFQVTGHPIPLVSWLHDGKPIKEGKVVSVTQNSEGVCELAISEVFPEDCGQYVCQAVNPAGEAVCSTFLAVERKLFYINLSLSYSL